MNNRSKQLYSGASISIVKPEILSIPTTLAILTLPYRNLKKEDGTPEILYKKNIIKNEVNYQLVIKSGYNEDGKEYGIPYGMYARALLYYICSEAKKTKSLEVNLGYAYKDILQKIKIIDKSLKSSKMGGKQIKDVKNQLNRLFNAEIIFKKSTNVVDSKIHNKDFVKIVENTTFLNKRNKPFNIKITREFYNLILSQSITVFDYSLVGKLKGKLLSLDLAIFLNYWSYNSQRYKKDLYLSYESLYAQFGSNSSQKEFNKNLKKAILEVQKYLPELHVMKKDDGSYEKGIVLPSYSKPIILSKIKNKLNLNQTQEMLLL